MNKYIEMIGIDDELKQRLTAYYSKNKSNDFYVIVEIALCWDVIVMSYQAKHIFKPIFCKIIFMNNI